MKLTAEIIREFLDYDKSTGVFTWRKRTRKWFPSDQACASWNGRYWGAKAGRVRRTCSGDRRVIAVLGKDIFAARLAYVHVMGMWPEKFIDHKDGKSTNDRWGNLRPATRAQNAQNCRLYNSNTSGLKGVRWHKKSGGFYAQINIKGNAVHLGVFPTAVAASAAYQRAAQKHFGEFYRDTPQPSERG